MGLRMRFGIVQPASEEVPGTGTRDSQNPTRRPEDTNRLRALGTAYVLDNKSRSSEDHDESTEPKRVVAGLKYDLSGKEPIILVPQPSDDPNDPLVRRCKSPKRNI